jgi:predicted deacylase
MRRRDFLIGGKAIAPGTRGTLDLPVSVLSNHTPMSLPVQVLHGREPGPVIFISGVIHGDEVMGVEVVRRLLKHEALARITGTLITVPIVNGYGLISHSRYLPDRRDLNRSFPGSDHGSLASVLADLLMREVVLRSDYGIDIHTAALHRSNLPQIRISPDDDELMKLGEVFGAPVILVSKLREGSLRKSAIEHGVKVMVYEGGEALRFEESAIKAAVTGCLRVMAHLGMIAQGHVKAPVRSPTTSLASHWLRAPQGGIFRSAMGIGDWIKHDDVLGVISDPLGESEAEVIAEQSGIIIGQSHLPVVNRGDALFHVARAPHPGGGPEHVEADEAQAPLFDEDEII